MYQPGFAVYITLCIATPRPSRSYFYGEIMTKKFADLKLVDGSRIIVNTSYITQVSPTHGSDLSNGADVVFIVFGEVGVVQASVPASEVSTLIGALDLGKDSQFIDITALNSARIILNRDYITHVTATHGTDLSNGADVSVWGVDIHVGAKEVPSLLPLLA
jgi:hypothetical protein